MPLLKRWMTETQAYAIQTNIPWRHADHMFINSWFSPANMKIKTVYFMDATETRLESYKQVGTQKAFPNVRVCPLQS